MDPITSAPEVFNEIDRLRSQKIVLFLDLDGTLVPIQDDYQSVTVADGTQKLLAALNTTPDRRVVIVSGRSPSFLEQHLGNQGIDFGAEHGGLFYDAKTSAWLPLLPESDEPTYVQVKQEMEGAETLLPGSDVEEKTQSLAWHYRQANPSDTFIGSLVVKLQALVKGTKFSILHGNKVIEARLLGATKEAFIRWYLRKHESELEGWYPVAIGDDRTDEDMFNATTALGGLSIKVGDGQTTAKYRVSSVTDVLEFLSRLATAA